MIVRNIVPTSSFSSCALSKVTIHPLYKVICEQCFLLPPVLFPKGVSMLGGVPKKYIYISAPLNPLAPMPHYHPVPRTISFSQVTYI